MLNQERLARINELAQKQRSLGLTVAEQAEQHALSLFGGFSCFHEGSVSSSGLTAVIEARYLHLR